MSQGILRAGVVQMCSAKDVAANLLVAEALVRQAVAKGAELVVLPESFAVIGRPEASLAIAEDLDSADRGPVLGAMQALARASQCFLLLGGTPTMTGDPERYFNTAVLLDPAGEIAAVYRKIHLFDVNIPDGAVLQESSHVKGGTEVVVTTVGPAQLGLSICYDLRFPELYRCLMQAGAQVLAVPAAFTMHTGKDHWFPLLRARAIENQAYVLAAAQHGRHSAHRISYGKSCIIDPWGAVIAQVSDGDGVAVADLDLAYLTRVRQQLPCLQHTRLLPHTS